MIRDIIDYVFRCGHNRPEVKKEFVINQALTQIKSELLGALPKEKKLYKNMSKGLSAYRTGVNQCLSLCKEAIIKMMED